MHLKKKKISESRFAIVVAYVGNLNLVETLEELIKTSNYLKDEFKMKDLNRAKFCLGLQIEHIPNKILFKWITLIL